MQLLISASTPADAGAALAGGADIIDAKNPSSGALGAVRLEIFRAMRASVGDAAPLTAAIGDASDERAIEQIAHLFASSGAAFVKLGFAGIESQARVEQLSAAAVRGVHAAQTFAGTVLVAYADAHRVSAIAPQRVIEIAARVCASGVLLDTADKAGPGLCHLLDGRALDQWVAAVHAFELRAAMAGKLTPQDLCRVRDAGADIAGIRGAACTHGRVSAISQVKVGALRAMLTGVSSLSSVSS